MVSSPFSLSHEWKLHWERIRPKKQNKEVWKGHSPKEHRAIQAVASIGVIGGEQLLRFFGIDKQRRSQMMKNKKLIHHTIEKDEQRIPICTVGPTGTDMTDLPDYKNNYWLKYNAPEVLKRLLFFELYGKFPKAKVLPAPSPFVGGIQFKSRLFYVYIVRGDMQDLLMHLKWQSSPERLLIVTESLNHLQPLNIFAPDLKVRVTTDEDLKRDFQNLFYYWNGSGWVKENQQAEKEKERGIVI